MSTSISIDSNSCFFSTYVTHSATVPPKTWVTNPSVKNSMTREWDWSFKMQTAWLEISLGDIDFCSSTIYRQSYIAIFDSIAIFFSFAHDCFRADNHRYVPFNKHYNKSQIRLHSVYVLLFCLPLPKAEKNCPNFVSMEFLTRLTMALIVIYSFNRDLLISR